mmetsp:Transcript_17957/g.38690  ORF Transcript_17957/g.38690 Transcript_17957/m.38690 type:complete len:101 (-) Transcript_17957:205-507(-)
MSVVLDTCACLVRSSVISVRSSLRYVTRWFKEHIYHIKERVLDVHDKCIGILTCKKRFSMGKMAHVPTFGYGHFSALRGQPQGNLSGFQRLSGDEDEVED